MNKKNIYFLGIGGIGMSAVARYFMLEGRRVGGYDRTCTHITRRLCKEGAAIHYEDAPALIPPEFREPASTLVVYTPAVPADHSELSWFRNNGFEVLKRSEILGVISEGKYVMAVAGTHGKTTTTTLLAWINHVLGETGPASSGNYDITANSDDSGTGKLVTNSGISGVGHNTGGSAFLGGISKNFGTNFVAGAGRKLAVEADEFDRSFLRLRPDVAVITSADADHLDIYGTHEELLRAFSLFAGLIKSGGTLIMHSNARVKIDNPNIKVYSYSLEDDCTGGADGHSDFHAANIRPSGGGKYIFDLVFPGRPKSHNNNQALRPTGQDTDNASPLVIKNCTLGIPGLINIENAVAAAAMAWAAPGFDEERLRRALATFEGVRRRFDFHILTPELVYMDDYAHHPEELRAVITSVRDMFAGRRLTVAFQPHLYTRTRDFYREFAEALSLADEVVLVPLYPAREEPIEGVSSDMIGSLLANPAAGKNATPYRIVPKEKLAETLAAMPLEVLLTAGAGDIENHCNEIAERLKQNN